MPTFIPPTRLEASSDPFFGRYRIPVGETVIRKNGSFVTQPYPWLGDLDGLTEGVDYFLGGHEYQINDEVADELNAAGYIVLHRGFGEPPYGLGPYGVV